MLSVTNDRASRLHQASILSSERHAIDRDYTSLYRTHNIFFIFCLQNSLNVYLTEKPGKGIDESIIWQTT